MNWVRLIYLVMYGNESQAFISHGFLRGECFLGLNLL